MQDPRVAVVDVDSILWDFLGVMKDKMRVMMPDKEIPEEFDTWDHPESFFDSIKDMIALFTEMHEEQDKYQPFDGAKEMLQSLRDKGYLIHIASNRPKHTRPVLIKWLDEQELPYDFCYADEDKRVIFNSPEIEILIDDAPTNQLAGLEREFLVLTLEYKYNRHIEDTYKFGCLNSMKNFIEKSVKSVERPLQAL